MAASKKDPGPMEVKALSTDEIRTRLAEGLLASEDLFFHDPQGFGKPRDAGPTEVEIDEPPQSPGGGPREPAIDGSLPEENAIIQTIAEDRPFAPIDTFAVRKSEASIVSSTTDRRRRLARRKSKDIALSVGLVGAVTLFAWWLLALQAESSAGRKLPTLSRSEEDPKALMVDNQPSRAPASAWANGPVSVRGSSGVVPTPERKSPPSPKILSRTRNDAPTTPAADSETTPVVDPEAKEWLNPTIDRQ